jgi:pimeloyl-ACP methyl ester carboxylesterase
MSAWRRIVAVLVGLAVAGLGALTPVATTPAYAQPNCSGGSDPVPAQIASRPVILVHGWTSSAGDPEIHTAAQQLERRLGSGYEVYRFDYGAVATYWAAQPEIAGCLADYIHSVSDAFTAAGGDGKVAVVTHSMGGLAIRFAADPKYGITNRLAGVVTLDAPYLGSPWGGTLPARVKELADHITSATTQKIHGGPGFPMRSGAADAATCLAPRTAHDTPSNGCAVPPYLPKATPVTAIVSNINLQPSLFGFSLGGTKLSIESDAIVPQTSQGGYVVSAAGNPTGEQVAVSDISCTITTDDIAHWWGVIADAMDAFGFETVGGALNLTTNTVTNFFTTYFAAGDVLAGRNGPALTEYTAAAVFAAPCSHINVPTYGPALDAAAAAVQQYAKPYVNNLLYDEQGWKVSLTGLQTSASGVRLTMTYKNGTSSPSNLQCDPPIKGFIRFGDSDDIPMTDSYCRTHPTEKETIQPGGTYSDWAYFPVTGHAGQSFVVDLWDWGLSDAEIRMPG